MAVYREGYHLLENLKNLNGLLGNGKVGIATRKGDYAWACAEQLSAQYAMPETRFLYTDKDDNICVRTQIKLIDEWAVSDEVKTLSEATELYMLTYVRNKFAPGYDGYFKIEKLNQYSNEL